QLEVLDRFCGEEQLAKRAEARVAWRELFAARRRHEELSVDAERAQARLAELRALAEDTEGMEPDDEVGLRAERERLRHVAELADAKRRFHCQTYEELLARAADARAELAALDGGADPAAAAAAMVAAAEARMQALAEELRAERNAAAPAFADAVAAELRDIGMGEGEFVCEVGEREAGATGADEALFLVRPNPGLPFAPVGETASGGELSRIALAIAAVAGGETLIFDEIDAGIGGETANAVGRSLKRLA